MFNSFYGFDVPVKVINPRMDKLHSNEIDPIKRANMRINLKSGGLDIYHDFVNQTMNKSNDKFMEDRHK